MKKSILTAAAMCGFFYVCNPAVAQESAAEFFASDNARVTQFATVPRVNRSRNVASQNHRGVHPRLIAFANRFDCRIISGYRPGARIAGTRRLSNHARGTAIDVRGCSSGAMSYARANGMGIGTYSRCTWHSHVHYSLSPRERYHRSCRGRR